MSSRFDLEKAIAAWRRPFEHNRAFSGEDLEELEGSLRDRVAALIEAGLTEEVAFREAVGRMGSYARAETEYRKVYWGKRRRRSEVFHELHWRLSMLKNYLVIAFRTLSRQKVYSFINVFGLAVGLACFLLILLFVQHELSYDRFHEKADRIYRVVQRQPGNVYLGSDYFAVTPALLARDLIEAFPEVEDATTFGNPTGDPNALLSLGDDHYWEQGLWADAHFFDVFTFPLLRGNPKTALAEPNSIVLTETLARKIFGGEDPTGQTLRYQNRDLYTVTGVMADIPETSHFTFTFITAIQSQPDYARQMSQQAWSQNAWFTYLVLTAGADAEELQAKMPAFVDQHRYADRQDEPEEKRGRFYLQPLTDIHLHSQINFEAATNGDVKYVYLFSAIALMILLLACVNYTNLAAARSLKRAREVGLRKVVGAARAQLLAQFLGESVLMTALALALGLLLVHLLLPVFGHLVERPLQMDYLGNRLLVPGLLALVVLVGLIAGSYPAVFMASLRPMLVFKGTLGGGVRRLWVQRVLIVGQYTVSIALVAGSLVVYEQMQFVQQKELGYDREHVVAVRVNDEALRRNYALVRDAWLRDPHVVAVASSRSLPINIDGNTGIYGWEGSSQDDNLRIYQAEVDYDYLDVFGIKLAAGRNFSRAVASDAAACLINETAARALGWTPEEAVGKHFMREGEQAENTVIGVMKDFHLHSMHLPIEPLLIYLNPSWMWYISAKLRSDDLPATMAFLEQTVKQFTPYPFEYQFLDETFDQLYRAERRLEQMVGFFTILALLIASLGLFGLAAYGAEQRTKEIGIRKVLGAGIAGLVTLLSQDFLKLVGLAYVVGAPLAYVATHRWLEGFAYRIELGPGVFLMAGGLSVVAALASVTYQAVKAALADPVRSLRYE